MTSTTNRPLIALINATPAGIPPASQAFAEAFPEAALWNLLDDRLLQSVSEQGGLTDDLRQRMARLVQHAVIEGATGILLTCSLYGPVAEELAATTPVPLLPPDGEAIREVLDSGHARVLVLASNEHSRQDTVARLRAAAGTRGSAAQVDGVVAQGAAEAALSGDWAALLTALRAAVPDAPDAPDALFLAQYSLTPVQEQLAAATDLPVFAGPRSAARALRAHVLEDQP